MSAPGRTSHGGWDDGGTTGRAVRTYYDDGSVRITSTSIDVEGRSHLLVELGRIWYRRGPRSWRALTRRGALIAAMTAPVLAAGLGAALTLWADVSLDWTVTGVALAVLVGLAAGPLADLLLDRMDRCHDRGARELEIWAESRGRPVLLLRTRDALRFGRIYRAVQRAVEGSGTDTY